MIATNHIAKLFICIAALIAPSTAETLDGWSPDLIRSLAKAKARNKSVLVEFTGSDWCPPCIAIRKNVFSKNEFVSVASKKFVLVEMDFPIGDPELSDKNQPFADKYNIDGFPTVLLLTPEGKVFDRFSASDFPTTKEFLDHLAGREFPELSVQHPRNREMSDGTMVSFGVEKIKDTSTPRLFVIKNLGKGELNRIAVRITGADRKNFIVSKVAKSSLARGKSTSFKVRFKPNSQGAKSARIKILSNDSDENPFEFEVTGTGIDGERF